MAERTTPTGLTTSGNREDGLSSIGDWTPENGMGHTHTEVNAATLYPLGNGTSYLGCFAWMEGEDVEERWDRFARQLWESGLVPVEDEPAFSVTEGKVTYDHYYIVSIYDQGEW